MPLRARVKGENLALPPVLRRHIREHAQQLPVGGRGDKGRIIQRMDHLPQPGHPQTAVLGKKRLGRRLVGGLPRTNVHRSNVAVMEKRANSPAAPTGESRYGRGSSPDSPTAAMSGSVLEATHGVRRVRSDAPQVWCWRDKELSAPELPSVLPGLSLPNFGGELRDGVTRLRCVTLRGGTRGISRHLVGNSLSQGGHPGLRVLGDNLNSSI